MRSFIVLTSILALAYAAPLPNAERPAVAQPVVAKIAEPDAPAPGTILIEPPPLFDPSEPRPALIFDTSRKQHPAQLRQPPIPESRTEAILPFTGAKVDPDHTPYPPDLEGLPGTCAHSLKCRVIKTSAEISIALFVLFTLAYLVVCACDKVVRRIMWTAKTRSRSPSGSLRMEPEIGSKSTDLDEKRAIKADILAPIAVKAITIPPLVKVWCEKGVERSVAFV